MGTMIFLDRGRRADHYPWLEWKVRLFVIGAALAIGGMIMDEGWLIGVAIVVLAAGFGLRFLPGGQGVRSEDEWPPPQGDSEPEEPGPG
jgi:hypothetical protein